MQAIYRSRHLVALEPSLFCIHPVNSIRTICILENRLNPLVCPLHGSGATYLPFILLFSGRFHILLIILGLPLPLLFSHFSHKTQGALSFKLSFLRHHD
jgi:hypothetical protein